MRVALRTIVAILALVPYCVAVETATPEHAAAGWNFEHEQSPRVAPSWGKEMTSQTRTLDYQLYNQAREEGASTFAFFALAGALASVTGSMAAILAIRASRRRLQPHVLL